MARRSGTVSGNARAPVKKVAPSRCGWNDFLEDQITPPISPARGVAQRNPPIRRRHSECGPSCWRRSGGRHGHDQRCDGHHGYDDHDAGNDAGNGADHNNYYDDHHHQRGSARSNSSTTMPDETLDYTATRRRSISPGEKPVFLNCSSQLRFTVPCIARATGMASSRDRPKLATSLSALCRVVWATMCCTCFITCDEPL
jgi:hypothetical protein